MIQRVQTIWLFSIAICTIIQICISSHDIWWNIGNGLIVIVSTLTVFLYKKRKLQIKLCYGMFILLLILDIPLFMHPKWIIIFPVIVIGKIFLTIKAIQKDEKLIRSLNRLR